MKMIGMLNAEAVTTGVLFGVIGLLMVAVLVLTYLLCKRGRADEAEATDAPDVPVPVDEAAEETPAPLRQIVEIAPPPAARGEDGGACGDGLAQDQSKGNIGAPVETAADNAAEVREDAPTLGEDRESGAEAASLTAQLERLQEQRDAEAKDYKRSLRQRDEELATLRAELADLREALQKAQSAPQPAPQADDSAALCAERDSLAEQLEKTRASRSELRKALNDTAVALRKTKGATSAEYLNAEIDAVLQRLMEFFD